jgi:hypothetical protein
MSLCEAIKRAACASLASFRYNHDFLSDAVGLPAKLNLVFFYIKYQHESRCAQGLFCCFLGCCWFELQLCNCLQIPAHQQTVGKEEQLVYVCMLVSMLLSPCPCVWPAFQH